MSEGKMQTHEDSDSPFMRRLRERADQVSAARGSEITAGKPGEKPPAEWFANGVNVKRLPDDEQGILRISIGGGDLTPERMNYCVFRGDREACMKLLRAALIALGNRRGNEAPE